MRAAHEEPGFEATFESGEHAEIGDGAGHETVDIHGEQVSLGEINALADYYASVDAMLTDSRRRFGIILEHLRKEMAEPCSVSPETWDKITDGEYTRLAQENDSHFGDTNENLVGDSGSAKATNASTWEENYRAALKEAQRAAEFRTRPGVGPDTIAGLEQRARITNAFGEHFLTDAYSAGHLFNKADYMERVREALTEARARDKKHLFEAVATDVWTEHYDLLTQYEYWSPTAQLAWTHLTEPRHLRHLMMFVDIVKKDVVENAAVRAAHDVLNHHPGGIPVQTGNGLQFTLPGDGTLESNPDARCAAELALADGRTLLEDAMQRVQDVEPLIERMRQWFPVPTPDGGETLVREVLEDVANVHGGMKQALTDVLKEEIEAVLAQLEDNKFVRRRFGVSPIEEAPPVQQLREHVVKPGEWLSTIAQTYYGDMARYVDIFDANKDRIPGFDDPDRIEVGWSLIIP